jgi:DNA repair exonuclease SbcCD ATPase subunit
VRLTTLEIQNFLSVEHADTRLDKRGLVLIKGSNKDASAFNSNGAGKSTIFSEAPVWALFGETVRGYKGDEVVNRTIGKGCYVKLGIEDDNGSLYRIERYRKDKQYKNSVLLFKGDKNITGKSDTDTTRMIEDLIQMDFLSFTNSVLFGQGISKKFANSTDAEQKKILERMLQIDIFKACQDLAKVHLSSTNELLSKSQTTLAAHIKSKAQYEQSVLDLQNKEAELGEKVRLKIEELEASKVGYEKQLTELECTDDLIADKALLKDLSGRVEDKISGFKKSEYSRSEVMGDIKSTERDILSTTKFIENGNTQLNNIKIGKDVPKVCEACGQGIPSKDTSHLEKHIKDDIEKKQKQVNDLKLEQEDNYLLLGKIDKLLAGKQPLEKQMQELITQIADIDSQIKIIDNKEKSINSFIASIDKQIKEQREMLDVTYTELINLGIKNAEETQVKIDEAHSEIAILTEQYEEYNFWVNAYGNQGIKSVLLDSVTPFLNERANHYLGKLTGSTMELQFNTQTALKNGEKRDKFSVDVNNENGDDKYKGNSGGEQRRIDVAVNMALQDLVHSRSNKKIDLIVYDEAYESLDATGCEVVVELLQEKAKHCESVIVITHNSDLEQLFDRTITIEKNNGKSRIIEESL